MKINAFDNFDFHIRKRIIYFIIAAAFSVITLKLFIMQIIQHEAYDVKSADNSIKGVIETPLRGVFYDRNLSLIVDNKPSYTIILTPAEYNRSNDAIIETVLDIPEGAIEKLLKENSASPRYIPIRVKRDADFKTIMWLEENRNILKGVSYAVEMQREYPAKVLGSHMFGYIKEISKKQFEKEKDFYTLGDYVGASGLEKKYEKYLRGIKGVNYFLYDAHRRVIGPYKESKEDIPSVKGYDIVLTIDAEAQRVAEERLKGLKGSLVAIDPKTGEILAFVSSPEFDLTVLSTVTSREAWQMMSADINKPLFNRASQSPNPPGSTFKILAAIAALEERVITPTTTFNCYGGYTYGDRTFACHGAHGSVNIERAIEKSCNTFFYQLIFKIGLDKWHDYAKRFGFGKKTDADIEEEIAGLVPNTDYYDRKFGKGLWPKGLLVSLGIGQGELSVTQLQLAQFAALVANNGKSIKPHFARGYIDFETDKLVPFKFEEIDVKINPETFNIVKKAMYLVVNGAGTASSIRTPDINIAGKTGTSQNPHGEDHALFICFAPYEDPQIAVSVLVENVGFGSRHAAPIARDVILAYLKDKVKNPVLKDLTTMKESALDKEIEKN